MNWPRNRPTLATLVKSVLWLGLLALGLRRLIGAGFMPATQAIMGDFGAVFPTASLAHLRPDFPSGHVWSGWYYGPMLHFLTLPLFLVPRWSQVPAAWAIVNLAAIVISFVLVRRLASPQPVSVAATGILAGMWMLYQPLANCLAQGNIEIIEMAMILGAIVALTRWKGRVSGVLIGVATMTKFLPIGFLFWFLLRRYWQAFVYGAATIAVIAAVTAVTLGWKDSSSLKDMSWAVSAPIAGPQELSITSLFLHRSSVLLHDREEPVPQSSPVVAWLPFDRAIAAARAGALTSLLLAAGFAVALFLRRHRPASANEVAVLFMTMFMILPWNHDYYYIFALVPLSVLVLAGLARRNFALLAATFAGYVLISPPIPFSWIDRTGWLSLRFSDVFSYLDLPIVGGLIVWLAAAYQMFADPQDPAVPSDPRVSARGRWIAAVAVTAGIAVLGVFWVLRPKAVTPQAMDTLGLEPAVLVSGPPAMALSPDGAHLAYVARRAGVQALCIRAIPGATTTCIPDTDDASSPFFSPDSRWIGFFAGASLKKVAVDGHATQVIRESHGGRVAEWESDGTILLATSRNGIMSVSADGRRLTAAVPQLAGDEPYLWPTLLPSRDAVLFTIPSRGGGPGAGVIMAYSFSTGRRKYLFPGSQPHFDETTGRLTYTLGGRVLAVPFDPVGLTWTGPSVRLVDSVLVTPDGGPQVVYGERGRIAYLPGSLRPTVRRQLVWVDRQGNETALPIPADAFQTPRVSPDGRMFVVGIRGVTTDLWRYEFATGSRSRLTFSAATNDTPVWASDGGIAFAVSLVPRARVGVVVAPPGGTELNASLLWRGDEPVRLGAWSPKGRMIVGTQAGDLWMVETSPVRAPQPPADKVEESPSAPDGWRTIVVQTTPTELGPVFSSDGRYVAYSSDESGRPEIYVQAVPSFSVRRQISTTGGTEPVWSRDGRELFYRNGNALMVVNVDSRAAFSAGAPRVLFRGAYVAGDGLTDYDVSADGGRFLMLKEDGVAPSTTVHQVVVR